MARKKGTPALSVDLPPLLHKALKQYARENDLAVSQIVRRLVRDFLEDMKDP